MMRHFLFLLFVIVAALFSFLLGFKSKKKKWSKAKHYWRSAEVYGGENVEVLITCLNAFFLFFGLVVSGILKTALTLSDGYFGATFASFVFVFIIAVIVSFVLSGVECIPAYRKGAMAKDALITRRRGEKC